MDGFIGDGDYSWSAPHEEVMAALTAGLAEVGTYLYGRRTYETMAVWETDPAVTEQSPESAGFAATWQAADKVVFSSTLAQVHTPRTRLERQLDAQVVAEIKAASDGDLTRGANAGRRGVAVRPGGRGGAAALAAGVRRDLRLRSERRFSNGVVQATYDLIGHVQP